MHHSGNSASNRVLCTAHCEHLQVLCVSQVVSLFPLFPGTNEMDQIEKIHAITGTPSPEILATMKRRSTHVEFDFPPKVSPSM